MHIWQLHIEHVNCTCTTVQVDASESGSDPCPILAHSDQQSGQRNGAALGQHQGLKGRLDAAHGPFPLWTRGLLPACCPGSRLPLPMASPPAPRCAGAPGRSGSLRCAAARTGSVRPFGLGLDAPPASRVPPRLRRGGGGGFAPRSCTGAGAPQIAGAICAWRRPPAPRQPGWGQVRLGGLRSACCLARRDAAAPTMDSGVISRPQTFKSNFAMQQRMHTCRNQE